MLRQLRNLLKEYPYAYRCFYVKQDTKKQKHLLQAQYPPYKAIISFSITNGTYLGTCCFPVVRRYSMVFLVSVIFIRVDDIMRLRAFACSVIYINIVICIRVGGIAPLPTNRRHEGGFGFL